MLLRFLRFLFFMSIISFSSYAQKPYHFTSTWQLKAPRKAVWDVINNSTQWSEWWKSIEKAEELYSGDSNSIGNVRSYTIKSPVGYKLHFGLELTKREPDSVLEGNATGDLIGKGAWYFKEKGSITTVIIRWDVATTIGWMNTFRFILSPILKWNHAQVMKKGAKGLARKMNMELISR